jgi:biotin operon repressor
MRLLEFLVDRGGEFDSISKLVEETKWSTYAVRKALKELQAGNFVGRNKNKFFATVWGIRLINSQDSNFAVTPYENL